jgi:hypothetical protein
MNFTYTECVSIALFKQHAKFLLHFMLWFFPCLSLLRFILSHKKHDFQKVIIEYKIWFSISYKCYFGKSYFFNNIPARCHKCFFPLCKLTFIVARFIKASILFHVFCKHYDIIVFFDNPSSGGRVIRCGHTDGRTETTNLIITFRKYAECIL